MKVESGLKNQTAQLVLPSNHCTKTFPYVELRFTSINYSRHCLVQIDDDTTIAFGGNHNKMYSYHWGNDTWTEFAKTKAFGDHISCALFKKPKGMF